MVSQVKNIIRDPVHMKIIGCLDIHGRDRQDPVPGLQVRGQEISCVLLRRTITVASRLPQIEIVRDEYSDYDQQYSCGYKRGWTCSQAVQEQPGQPGETGSGKHQIKRFQVDPDTCQRRHLLYHQEDGNGQNQEYRQGQPLGCDFPVEEQGKEKTAQKQVLDWLADTHHPAFPGANCPGTEVLDEQLPIPRLDELVAGDRIQAGAEEDDRRVEKKDQYSGHKTGAEEDPNPVGSTFP